MARIVVVGGGAGGLELVARLTRGLDRKFHEIVLVDRELTHVWKPLLHEVAAGTFDSGRDAIEFSLHARSRGYRFMWGELAGINRAGREIELAPILDGDGDQLTPRRTVHYDYLVFALGGATRDFGVDGVREHCFFLDKLRDVQRLHDLLMRKQIAIAFGTSHPAELKVAIIGGGATGVELAAELHHAVEAFNNYGLARIRQEQLKIDLFEAMPTILGQFPEDLRADTEATLADLGITVHTNAEIRKVTAHSLETADKTYEGYDFIIWASGVEGSPVADALGDLEVDQGHRIVVRDTLQTTSDPKIYALGDCCACVDVADQRVPPRAQAANQMAKTVAHNLLAQLAGRRLRGFRYRDKGAVVSLSRYATIGLLNFRIRKGKSMAIEGQAARAIYVSLYQLHQFTVVGFWPTFLRFVYFLTARRIQPSVKVH